MSVLARAGSTPLVELDGVFVKLECANPTGSIKDRIGGYMLEEARRRGELRPGDVVVEATSGNTGIALALAGRELGHRVVIFMPEHVSEERKRMLTALGAELRLTPKEGGYRRAIEERDAHRDRPGYHVPDQFSNPDNVACHRRETGAELVEQLRERGVARLDAFVAGVGTGGTLMGVGEALREAHGPTRLVAVEPAESPVMSGGEAGEHDIQGIGDGFVPDLVDMSRVDEVACVSTDEAREEARRIRREHGYCVGLSAGANLLAARGLLSEVRSVATVFPDCSDRYGTLGLAPPEAAGPGCPLRQLCSERSRDLLEPEAGSSDPPAGSPDPRTIPA